MRKYGVLAVAVIALGLCLTASATSYTNTNVGTSYVPAHVSDVYVAQAVISFAATPMNTNDTLFIMGIPKGATVLHLMYDVVTTNTPTATPTVDIGVTGTATQFKSNASMATVGALLGITTAYTAAANIKMILTADDKFTDGVLRVWATIALEPGTVPTQGTTP